MSAREVLDSVDIKLRYMCFVAICGRTFFSLNTDLDGDNLETSSCCQGYWHSWNAMSYCSLVCKNISVS